MTEAETFVGRHVSMFRALLACGLHEHEARGLLGAAYSAGRTEVRITRGGRVLVVRRMRGNHAEVWWVEGKTTP